MSRIATLIGVLALAAGFYLLLIDTIDPPELYVLCGVALGAVALFGASRREGLTEAAISWRWLLGSWRIAWRVPVHVVLLCREALAQLAQREPTRGSFRAVSFRGGQRPRDAGRRALTEALGSLAPNTIVIGVDPDRELLLVHQLHRQGGAEELDVLGLG